MTIRRLTLPLNDLGTQANFTVAGNGPRIAYIVGPGSFYLKELTAMYPDITFVSCDEGEWTHRKSAPDHSPERFQDMTAAQMVERDAQAIAALKQHFGCEKVALFGFSAPGAILGPQLLARSPENISCFVGTGIALSKTDPEFKASDEAFKTNEPQRYNLFVAASLNLAQLVSGTGGEALSTTNFKEETLPENSAVDSPEAEDEKNPKPTHKRNKLSENSLWVEGMVGMAGHKAVADPRANVGKIMDEHWRYAADPDEPPHQNQLEDSLALPHRADEDHAVAAQPPVARDPLVLSATMRNHVFGTLQKDALDATTSLTRLKQAPTTAAMPMLVVMGTKDYITYSTQEEHEQLKTQGVQVETYPAGHFPYREVPQWYADTVSTFVNQHTPIATRVEEEKVAPAAHQRVLPAVSQSVPPLSPRGSSVVFPSPRQVATQQNLAASAPASHTLAFVESSDSLQI